MQRQNVTAIVLKNISYQDQHKLYTLFTLEAGKISAIARGVRKISSRRAGNLDTLNLVSLQLTENEKGFKSITEASVIDSFRYLKEHYELIMCGLYMAELIDIFLEEAADTGPIFNLFKNALTNINKPKADPRLITNAFELRLLKMLGMGIELTKCVSCGNTVEVDSSQVKISIETGGYVCTNCKISSRLISSNTFRLLKRLESPAKSDNTSEAYTRRDLNSVSDVIQTHLKWVVQQYTHNRSIHRFLIDSTQFN